jgi:hypothetical protein
MLEFVFVSSDREKVTSKGQKEEEDLLQTGH